MDLEEDILTTEDTKNYNLSCLELWYRAWVEV